MNETTPEHELEEPEVFVVSQKEVTEHSTKVVEPQIIPFGKLLYIRCNICQIDMPFGRQTKEGKYLVEAWCQHISFVGIKVPK